MIPLPLPRSQSNVVPAIGVVVLVKCTTKGGHPVVALAVKLAVTAATDK
jgi:hypothetical protein